MITASSQNHEAMDVTVEDGIFNESMSDEHPVYKTTLGAQEQLELILSCLEDNKAENIVTIDLSGKSSLADYMVIASGRSSRHSMAMADHLAQKLKTPGSATPPIEGLPQADWVLIDAGDVIVHLFRPEVRTFYNLERMWMLSDPAVACMDSPVDLDPAFGDTEGGSNADKDVQEIKDNFEEKV